jgi:hypothetical protein
MLRVVTDDEGRAEMRAALDEIVLDGARRMLAAALEAEVDAYVAALVEHRDVRGHGWWCATAALNRAPSPPRRDRSR